MSSRPPSGRPPRRSTDDLEADLDRRLSLADPFIVPGSGSIEDDYSLISGLGASTTTPRGEFTPSYLRARSSPTFMGGGGEQSAAPRGSTNPLPIIFLGEQTIDRICLGRIGSSQRFCVARKVSKLNHCGTTSHSRNKLVVEKDTFWAPGGNYINKPTAINCQFVKQSELSVSQLDYMTRALLPSSGWIKHLTELNVKLEKKKSTNTTTSAQLHEEEDDMEEEDDEIPKDPMEEDDAESRLSNPSISTSWAADTFDPPPMAQVPTFDAATDNWVKVAEDHQAALQSLSRNVAARAEKLPVMARKIRRQILPKLEANSRAISSLQLDSEEVQDQISDIVSLAMEHGSLSTVIKAVLSKQDKSNDTLAKLDEQFMLFHDALEECAGKTASTKASLLSMIKKIMDQMQRSNLLSGNAWRRWKRALARTVWGSLRLTTSMSTRLSVLSYLRVHHAM